MYSGSPLEGTQKELQWHKIVSLVRRPSHHPVIDRLQYAQSDHKLDGEKAWKRGFINVVFWTMNTLLNRANCGVVRLYYGGFAIVPSYTGNWFVAVGIVTRAAHS